MKYNRTSSWSDLFSNTWYATYSECEKLNCYPDRIKTSYSSIFFSYLIFFFEKLDEHKRLLGYYKICICFVCAYTYSSNKFSICRCICLSYCFPICISHAGICMWYAHMHFITLTSTQNFLEKYLIPSKNELAVYQTLFRTKRLFLLKELE